METLRSISIAAQSLGHLAHGDFLRLSFGGLKSRFPLFVLCSWIQPKKTLSASSNFVHSSCSI